jgi:hypothetical protein
LTTTAPVDLWAGGTVDFGDGNLCAQCHQGRPIAAEEFPTIGGDPVTFTSTRYGYHYGIEGNIMGGYGLFEWPGGAQAVQGVAHVHGDADVGCSTCHMADPYGAQAGGHTWAMTYEYHGGDEDLTAGCEGCHSSIEDFGLYGLQDAVQAKMDQLQALLLAEGILGADGYRVPGTWPANVAAAALVYQSVLKDGSNGIHNPPYVKAQLDGAIAALQ